MQTKWKFSVAILRSQPLVWKRSNREIMATNLDIKQNIIEYSCKQQINESKLLNSKKALSKEQTAQQTIKFNNTKCTNKMNLSNCNIRELWTRKTWERDCQPPLVIKGDINTELESACRDGGIPILRRRIGDRSSDTEYST